MNIIEWGIVFSPMIIMILGVMLWIKQSRIKTLETWNLQDRSTGGQKPPWPAPKPTTPPGVSTH